MEQCITQLEEGEMARAKKAYTLIAFPQILAARGGNTKRQTVPEEGGDERIGGQRKVRERGEGVFQKYLSYQVVSN